MPSAPDLSRQDLMFFTALAALGGFAAGVAVAPLALGATTGASAWTGVVGALVGGSIGIFGTTYHDRRRRKLELEELKASLYAEIADRAARCVNDYLKPWRRWEPTAANPLTRERVAKFRPKDPLIFNAVAGKLGLLPADVLIPVMEFYYRLDHLTSAIESLAALCAAREKPGQSPPKEAEDEGRAKRIVDRLQSCFEPALRALQKLGVPEATFDQEIARPYPFVRGSGETLRGALEKYASQS